MKAFFSKVWSWILANKIISIIIAGVLVVGITLAIVLPIALKPKHEHEFNEVVDVAYVVSQTDTTTTYKKSCTCGETGSETFTKNKTVTQITNVEAEYEYTGAPVDFKFDVNSNGAVTYVWYEDGDSTPLTEAPDYTGEFSVLISVAGTHEYTAVEDEYFGFEITPKLLPVPTVLTKTYDGTSIIEYTFDASQTGTGESVTVKLDMRDTTPENNPVKNAGTYDETTVELWAEFYWGGTHTLTSCYDFVDEFYHNQSTYDITVNKYVVEGEWNIGVSWLAPGISYSETKGSYYYTVYVPSQYTLDSNVILLVYIDTRDINAQVIDASFSNNEISKNYEYDSEKFILTNPIKDTTNSFNSVLTIGCQNAQSYTANMVAGQKVYIKINGAGGTLNDFWFKATSGSTATYTYEVFRASDRTTPIDSNATAGQHEIFLDIADTIDYYLVVTCVTGGEISITSD